MALLLALIVAVPALADEPEPFVKTCSASQFGDLGRGWRDRAAIAGHVAFVGMGSGYNRMALDPVGPGRANPLKVLVVVDPHASPTVTIAARSRAYAALGYNGIQRKDSSGVPLADGTASVRFYACRPVQSRKPWNRGTQFGGYFLVIGARCVHIEVATQGTVLRRKLSFGARVARERPAAPRDSRAFGASASRSRCRRSRACLPRTPSQRPTRSTSSARSGPARTGRERRQARSSVVA